MLAASRIKELPCAVLSGYYTEYKSSDDDDEASDACEVDCLLDYLKREIKARRRSIESQGTRSISEQVKTAGKGSVKQEGKEQPFRMFFSKKDKRSSCIQECQHEVSDSGDVDSNG